jgi:hypothetical protein
VRAFREVFIEPSLQVTSAGASTPTDSTSCAVEQQRIGALEAANALLNATVVAQAAEIAGLRSRLLGRSKSHYAPASTPIAAPPPPPPPPYLRSGQGGTGPISPPPAPPLRAPTHSLTSHQASFVVAHISPHVPEHATVRKAACALAHGHRTALAPATLAYMRRRHCTRGPHRARRCGAPCGPRSLVPQAAAGNDR